MKELSLNILDIVQNSIAAGAEHIGIALIEDADGKLQMTVCDDGCGMHAETLARVTDPFCTSRKTRKVGMGIPLLRLAAEQVAEVDGHAVEEDDLVPLPCLADDFSRLTRRLVRLPVRRPAAAV